MVNHLKVAGYILSCEVVNIHQVKNLLWYSICIILTLNKKMVTDRKLIRDQEILLLKPT